MRSRAAVAAVLAAAVAFGGVGCGAEPEEQLQPKIAPPVIGTAGTLRAGIDLTYPPFGGTDKGIQAGLDADVAAALADRLGLRLEIVSVTPSTTVSALESATVDVVIAALPITDSLLADVTFAGTYVTDGPVLFAAGADEATITLDTLGERAVGVQEGSASFWLVEDALGEGGAVTFKTLRDAFTALREGTVGVVVADGIVGAYLARDFPEVRIAGQAAPATPLGVAVRKDATDLEAAVRGALDELAADGVLDQLRSKWATPLPELEVPSAPAEP